MMIATAPLTESQWKEIGAADRVLFGDARRILSYAQRTADGRIALGAGGLYVRGSGALAYFPPDSPHFREAEHAYDALGAPFHLAVTQLEHAESLETRGPSDEADALRGSARSVFEQLRATPWLERADRAPAAEQVTA